MNKLFYDTDSTFIKWEIHPIIGNPVGFFSNLEMFSHIDLNMNNLVLILTYV